MEAKVAQLQNETNWMETGRLETGMWDNNVKD